MVANIENWIICISGFLQSHGSPNGISGLWSSLRQQSSADTCVLYQTWEVATDDLAEFIWRFRPETKPPRILITGYSWGGQSAINLCQSLAHRGIDVEHLILCDAVYRHRSPLLSWLSLISWRKLRVPANVRKVQWFYQRTNKPAGHVPIAINPKRTEITKGTQLYLEHAYMDDSTEYQLTVKDAVSHFLT